METKPIFILYDINKYRGGSTNKIAVSHENNVNTRFLEVALVDGDPLPVDADCTATAAIAYSLVGKRKRYLVDSGIACEVTEGGTVLVPIDNLGRLGTVDLWVELSIADAQGNSVLTLPYPIWVRVNASVLDDAEVTPESGGPIAALLEEAAAELARVSPFEDGKSAYEIAVSQGFSGSEADWLASLDGNTAVLVPATAVWEQGGIVMSDGSKEDSETVCRTQKIPMKKGERLLITANGMRFNYGFYDKRGVAWQPFGSDWASGGQNTVTADGYCEAVVWVRMADGSALTPDRVSAVVTYDRDRIDEAVMHGTSAFEDYRLIREQISSTDGKSVTNIGHSKFLHTNYLNTAKIGEIRRGTGAIDGFSVFLYDDNHDFLRRVTVFSGDSLTPDADVRYVRIQLYANIGLTEQLFRENVSILMISKDAEQDSRLSELERRVNMDAVYTTASAVWEEGGIAIGNGSENNATAASCRTPKIALKAGERFTIVTNGMQYNYGFYDKNGVPWSSYKTTWQSSETPVSVTADGDCEMRVWVRFSDARAITAADVTATVTYDQSRVGALETAAAALNTALSDEITRAESKEEALGGGWFREEMQGGIVSGGTGNGSLVIDSATDAITPTLQTVSRGCMLTTDRTKYKIFVWQYSGGSWSQLGWQTADVALEEGFKGRFVFRRLDLADMTAADVEELNAVTCYHRDTAVGQRLTALEDEAVRARSTEEGLGSGYFKTLPAGGIVSGGTGNGSLIIASATDAVTPTLQEVAESCELTTDWTKFKAFIWEYSGGAWSQIGWKTANTALAAGFKGRFVFRRLDLADMSAADVEELNAATCFRRDTAVGLRLAQLGRRPQRAGRDFISICHQGYSDAAALGYSHLGGYARARERGFDYGETDVKLSSDHVPVCSHDATFDDPVYGTVTIADHTAADLKTYSYHGGTIATLEEVLCACKENGIGLVLDHITNDNIGYVLPVVKKYGMQRSVIYLIGWASGNPNYAAALYGTITAFCPQSAVMFMANTGNQQEVLAFLQELTPGEGRVYLTLNHANYPVADLIAIIEGLSAAVSVAVWTIDDLATARAYLPHVAAITSNKISGAELFDEAGA